MSHSKMACKGGTLHRLPLHRYNTVSIRLANLSRAWDCTHQEGQKKIGWRPKKRFQSPEGQTMVCLLNLPPQNLMHIVQLCIILFLSVQADTSSSSLCFSSVCPPLLFPQGFLKNERDNALLSAIEESRRRVSICPVSDWFSGRLMAD